MTFKLYDVVKNRSPLPTSLAPGGTIPAGSTGTVLGVYSLPTPAYEVEFADADGRTLLVVALREADLLPG